MDINQPGSTAGTSAALIMDEIKDHAAAQTEEVDGLPPPALLSFNLYMYAL